MKLLTRILFVLFLLAGVRPLSARQIDPSTPPPPPPPETPGAPKAKQISPSEPPPPPSEDEPSTPSQPVFDPLHAQRSIDVGTFYMKAGKYDAAIDRFDEATHYQPGLAAPWKLLGEAYEKKHDYRKSAESYKKYLEVMPRAEDAEKIRKHIAELEEKPGQENSKDSTHSP